MKMLIAAAIMILAGQKVFAMPEGTFDCVSNDKSLEAHFTMTNYGDPVLVSLNSLILNGKSVEVKGLSIQRQWIEAEDSAKVAVSLPKGKSYSRTLVISVSTEEGAAMHGSALVQSQARSYTDPVKQEMKKAIYCLVNP